MPSLRCCRQIRRHRSILMPRLVLALISTAAELQYSFNFFQLATATKDDTAPIATAATWKMRRPTPNVGSSTTPPCFLLQRRHCHRIAPSNHQTALLWHCRRLMEVSETLIWVGGCSNASKGAYAVKFGSGRVVQWRIYSTATVPIRLPYQFNNLHFRSVFSVWGGVPSWAFCLAVGGWNGSK